MVKVKMPNWKSIKRKRILAVALLGVFVLIGGAFAYSGDLSFFSNLFHLGSEKVQYTEDIPFPLENWATCEEKLKSVNVTNVEGSDKYIRVKFREAWKKSDDQTELSSVKDGVTLAIKNFDDNWETGWELRDDGYYYYKTKVPAGQTTAALLKSVTLNCDANLGQDNICTQTETGQVCTAPQNDYEGAKYHLYIDIEASSEPMGADPHQVDCDSDNLYDATVCQASTEPYEIDFRRGAVISSNEYEANGNGVNTTTENSKTVYYYRGQINNNYVLWADKCWRIVRTTATGGTKMIYIGEASNGQCPERAITMSTDQYSYGYMWDSYIGSDDYHAYTWTMLGDSGWDCEDNAVNLAIFGYSPEDCYDSYADVGYKFGIRSKILRDALPSGSYAWANDVSYSNGHYTLDPATTISGDYSSDDDFYESIIQDHHYSCLSTSTTCDTVYYLMYGRIHLAMSGGDKIDEYREKAFSNQSDSVAKIALEYWYDQNIASHGNDLEDAIFCNDRSLYSGPLKSKDEYPYVSDNLYYAGQFNVTQRNNVEVNNNFHPSLDCSQKDSYAVANEASNKESNRKIGLLTADELTLAGINKNGHNGSGNYLNYYGSENYLMSPYALQGNASAVGSMYSANSTGLYGGSYVFQSARGVPGVDLRPVVSLKQSIRFTGTGTRTDPYVAQ